MFVLIADTKAFETPELTTPQPSFPGFQEDQRADMLPNMSAADSLPLFNLTKGPDFSIEANMLLDGRSYIAGVDEAGRGPLAGPVVAAAVILDRHAIPSGLNDSKQLTEKKREHLFEDIMRSSHVAWASVPAEVIDSINIREASLLAMTRAAQALPVIADCALIDGRDIPAGLIQIGSSYVKGDARSVSISAASIIAKVVRDRMMVLADEAYPQYGFASHKGYGSESHRDAIAEFGPCSLHRKSFSPIRQMVE